jgi:hypothetical protein
MDAEGPAVAYKASWREFFKGRNCSTFLNQFFHIFLSTKLPKLSVPKTLLGATTRETGVPETSSCIVALRPSSLNFDNSRGNFMLRPGIITSPLFDSVDTLKKRILLYDELWVPGVSSWIEKGHIEDPDVEEIENRNDEELLASVAWLVTQGFIKEPPVKLARGEARSDAIVEALRKIYSDAAKSYNKTYATAMSAAKHAAAAIFNMDLAQTRAIAYVFWRDHQKRAFPVIFPFREELAPASSVAKTQHVLSIVLKRLPDPRPDLPLEDIVAFKRDPETIEKFERFWRWTRKLAKGGEEIQELEEELDWLPTDYTRQVERASKKARYDRLKVWVTVPAETLENLIKLRFGKIAATLIDLKKASIAAHEDEVKLPGGEIAYVKESIELLSPKRQS